MSFLISAFNTFLYNPLFNALVIIYNYIPGHDFGVAIILLTVLIRILLYPSMKQSIRSQKALQEIQPKLKEIQAKYKNDKEGQAREMMALYKKEKINPFGGLLPLFVQLPILIALYRVFWQGLKPGAMSHLYGFVANPGTIDPNFLGILNLAEPNLALALLAGVAQFFQSKMLAPKKQKNQGGGISGMLQKQMTYLFPIFTVFILFRLPAAIGIYWIITSLFMIGQQYLLFKKPKEHGTATN